MNARRLAGLAMVAVMLPVLLSCGSGGTAVKATTVGTGAGVTAYEVGKSTSEK